MESSISFDVATSLYHGFKFDWKEHRRSFLVLMYKMFLSSITFLCSWVHRGSSFSGCEHWRSCRISVPASKCSVYSLEDKWTPFGRSLSTWHNYSKVWSATHTWTSSLQWNPDYLYCFYFRTSYCIPNSNSNSLYRYNQFYIISLVRYALLHNNVIPFDIIIMHRFYEIANVVEFDPTPRSCIQMWT